MVDIESFKKALRCWASGVTVLTTKSGADVHGMTVSAFSSVSADPPLVLVCANQSSTTHEMIWSGKVFAVNILSGNQQTISDRFAFGDAQARFEGLDWREGSTGAPLIDGALAQIECRVRSAHHEGSHTIYIGEVLAVSAQAGEPLLYFAGGYRRLA